MHCTDTISPTAHASLHDRLLMLRLQVMPFTQHHINEGLSVCSLGHFQQFRWHLIEPAAIHMQRRSQNLAMPMPPPFYCGNIVVLVIVLYCIMIATVSHLIHPVAGMTSHTTHRAAWLSGQVACSYSAVALHCWCAHNFTYRWPCHVVHSGIAVLPAHDIVFCI